MLTIFLLISIIQPQLAKYKVEQVTEFCRHGARTAFVYFPNATTIRDLGSGILTPNGHRMHYMLGKQIRKQYPSIFNDNLTSKDVEILASSVERTHLSALSQMAGLFPLGQGKNITSKDPDSWTPQFQGYNVTSDIGDFALPAGYRPVPINIISIEQDFLFLPKEGKISCPAGYKLDVKARKESYAKFNYVVGDLGEQLENIGFSSKTLYLTDAWDINTLGQFSSEIKCYINYYGKVPDELPLAIWDRLERFNAFKFFMDYYDRRIVTYKGEMSARAFLAGMEEFVNEGPNRKKFRLFSGHDTSLYPYTIGFNLTDLQCNLDLVQGRNVTRRCEKAPGFASNYIFELASKHDQYYVRILYNNVPVKICKDFDDDYCEFLTFRKVFSDLMINNEVPFLDICGNEEALNSRETAFLLTYESDAIYETSLIGCGCIVLLVSVLICRVLAIKHAIDKQARHAIFTKHGNDMTDSFKANDIAVIDNRIFHSVLKD